MNELTARERDIYEYIRDYCARYGFAPTTQEIADMMQWKSKGTVHRYLNNLVTKGKLARPRNGWRNLAVTDLSLQSVEDAKLLESLKRLIESDAISLPGITINRPTS